MHWLHFYAYLTFGLTWSLLLFDLALSWLTFIWPLLLFDLCIDFSFTPIWPLNWLDLYFYLTLALTWLLSLFDLEIDLSLALTWPLLPLGIDLTFTVISPRHDFCNSIILFITCHHSVLPITCIWSFVCASIESWIWTLWKLLFLLLNMATGRSFCFLEVFNEKNEIDRCGFIILYICKILVCRLQRSHFYAFKMETTWFIKNWSVICMCI